MATNRKRRTVCAGALLAVGLMGSGCMESEEDAGSSLQERREAQLRAQPFQSYGDGKLQQEIKPAAPPGTGGSGAVPGSGTVAPPQGPANAQGMRQGMQGQAVPAQQQQAGGPAWRLGPGSGSQAAPVAPQTNPEPAEQRPRRDSGSSEKN